MAMAEQVNISEQNLTEAVGRLNPQQRDAALNLDGPELIVAGAGSGKTAVLTTRTALLLSHGVPPERILALTFTKKAAEEMRKRITALAGPGAQHICMGTFHSVFIRFLRPYAHLLGFGENFTILDEDDSKSVMRRVSDAILGAGRPPRDTWTQQQKTLFDAADRKYKSALSIISACKNDLITADMYNADENMRQADTAAGRPVMGRLYSEYVRTCFQSNVMDFDDILLYTDILFANHPEVCAYIAGSFDYILVDEYQDTNRAQYSILRRLTRANHNICVVGDDSQSIYAFRGARIENIFNFSRDYPEAKICRLEHNYRSSGTIVDSANRLIEHNEERIPKKCFTTAPAGEDIDFIECEDDRSEAEWIAESIRLTHNDRNLKWSDFAVFYRTNSQSRTIEDALVRKGIPYIVYSGVSFFQRAEIKDLLAYFKLAVNPDDDESFRRVVNKPLRGVGKAAADSLCAFASNHNTSLWRASVNPALPVETGIRPSALSGIASFRTKLLEYAEIAMTKTALETARYIADDTGFYKNYIEQGTEEGKDRADNIRELVDSVKNYEDDLAERNKTAEEDGRKESTLADYLESVSLLTNADTKGKKADSVNLMTVHCSKGLEFDTVVVTGMEKKLFPLEIEGTEKEREEERRLFYVACTRAKRKLTLTRAEKRLRFGQVKPTEVSSFVDELLGKQQEQEQNQ